MTDDLSGGSLGGSSGASAGMSEILESVEVSGGSDEEAPTVEFDQPLEITGSAARTVVDGDGDAIEVGQQVRVHIVSLNAETGERLVDSYASAPQVLPVNEQLQEELPDLYEVLVESRVGAQIALTQPLPEGSQTPQQLLVLRVVSVEDIPAEPTILPQEDVQRLDDDGQLPTITLDGDAPQVSIPDNDPSQDLVVKVLEEGDGDVVTEADSVTVNYSGWTYTDGEQFDSSFERGEPASFPLTGVITGWTNGLAGQKVGSTVLLVVPALWAYGDPATQGRPSGTLVFYVDIISKDSGQ